MTAATPAADSHIQKMARRHRVRAHGDPQAAGIGSDRHFAMQAVRASWMTMAHQDDLHPPTSTTVANYRFACQHNRVPLEQ